MAKNVCKLSDKQFLAAAKPLTVEIKDADGKVLAVQHVSPRTFSTGTIGYHGNGKMSLEIDGEAVSISANLGLYLDGSKDRSRDQRDRK